MLDNKETRPIKETKDVLASQSDVVVVVVSSSSSSKSSSAHFLSVSCRSSVKQALVNLGFLPDLSYFMHLVISRQKTIRNYFPISISEFLKRLQNDFLTDIAHTTLKI